MPVRVLDTTIRDGGYEIAHQFTEEDVALVVGTLDAAGVSLIEIGYGMGVGAHRFPPSTRPKDFPVAGDLAHMRTARQAARRAKIGVLFGAGDIFCPVDYLDEVAAAGIDFVRLAFMPADVTAHNMRYVERARELGMTVSINCMQSYILSPVEIAKLAAMSHTAGCHWWYVVDSAGGMQPAEVRQYIRAIREVCDIEIGLHAHNNLGLAVANCLAAVDEGATLVDGSFNGLGRATGNAPTEQLFLALKTAGHEPDVDLDPILRLSEMYRVLFEGKGNDPMHFVSGASMLHSRNVPAVLAQATERGLSRADFLVRVGSEARKESCLARFQFPPEVFDRAARDCKPAQTGAPTSALVSAISDRLVARELPRIELVCEDLAVRAARYHVPSVLHLVPAELFPFSGALPWQSESLVGVSVAWTDTIELGAHRRPSYVAFDTSLAGRQGAPAGQIRSLVLGWQDLWYDAIRSAVLAVASDGARVWVEHDDSRDIVARLRAAGIPVTDSRRDGERCVLVGSTRRYPDWIERIRANDVVILTDRGPSARDVADAVRRAGAHALVPPIGMVVAARMQELVALSAHVNALIASPLDAPWVDPVLAPGTAHAVADVGLSAIIEPGPGDRNELVAAVAHARASALARGKGRP